MGLPGHRGWWGGSQPPLSCPAIGVTRAVRQGARHARVLARNQFWGSLAPSYLSLAAGGADPAMFGLCMLQRPELAEENSTY